MNWLSIWCENRAIERTARMTAAEVSGSLGCPEGGILGSINSEQQKDSCSGRRTRRARNAQGRDSVGSTPGHSDTATTFEKARELLTSWSYELVILDIMGVRGFELLQAIVPFLEDVLTHEYGPVWKRLLKDIEGAFSKAWGPYWRKPDDAFWAEFESKIAGKQ
jgi:hypothetical protein